MQDEQEAAYWDIFDDMTEDWDKVLEEKKEWLMPPTIRGEEGKTQKPTTPSASKFDGVGSSGSVTVQAPDEPQATVGNNSK